MVKRLIVLCLLGIFSTGSVIGCDGPVTEEDLQLWTHNSRGLTRLSEVISSPEQPMTTRIRGLEVVVEKGFSTQVRTILDDVTEGRDELVKGTVEQLIDHLAKKDEHQLNAKDALIAMQRYIPVEDFKAVRSAIAKWAFVGLSWESSPEEVQKLGNKISTGQIRDLGTYGYEGSGYLLRHGFNVDKVSEYLVEARDPAATAVLMKAMKFYHASGNIGAHHLAAIAKTNSVEAAEYLLDIYLNTALEADIRAQAFNGSILLLDIPAVKKNGKSLVSRLLKLLVSEDPSDRWLGAVNLIHMDGVNQLQQILDGFKTDRDYTNADETPLKSVMDLCLDIRDKGHGEKAVPVFMKNVTHTNPNIAAISIVCLKGNQAHHADPQLRELAKAPRPGKEISLARFLGSEITIHSLAQNAIEGLAMLKAVDADEKSGKLGKKDATNKRDLITFEIEDLGATYTETVGKRFAAAVAFRKQEEAAAKAAAQPPPAPAPAPDAAPPAGEDKPAEPAEPAQAK
jgi:lysozyme family protein